MNFIDDADLAATDPDINIIPLIDVLFFIIIFFVVSTTFTETSGLAVNLPSSSIRQIQVTHEDYVVSIAKDGKLMLGDRKVTAEELSREFSKLGALDKKPLVIVRADREVEHGEVVRIMSMAKQVGLEQLAIATSAEQGR